MTDPRVAAIEKRLSEATEGPFDAIQIRGAWRVRSHEPEIIALMNCIDKAENNASLFANAPSDLRYLLDQLKAHTEAKETKQ